MKKWMSGVLLLACMAAMSGCGRTPAADTDLAEKPIEEKNVQDETWETVPQRSRQEMANSAYGQILDSFGGLLPHDPGFPGYAEEFGDAYYEDGDLVVCLTDTSEEMQEKYRALVDTPELLRFQKVEYSYNDLYALQMAIKPPEDIELTSWGVDVKENCVTVGIPDLSKEEEVRALILEGIPQDVKDRFPECPITFVQEGFVSTAQAG